MPFIRERCCSGDVLDDALWVDRAKVIWWPRWFSGLRLASRMVVLQRIPRIINVCGRPNAAPIARGLLVPWASQAAAGVTDPRGRRTPSWDGAITGAGPSGRIHEYHSM